MTNLFNHEAVTCIIRETIEHSLRFFDSINERLLEIAKDVRPDMPLPTHFDEMNKVCADYRNEHRALITRMETVWRDTFAHINDPKNRENTELIVDSFKNLIDPNEVLRLNRDVMNTTVSFFFKTGESLFKAFDTRHPITTPKDLIDLIDRARDEYISRHHELTLEITNIMRTAVDPTHTPRTTDVRDEKIVRHDLPVNHVFDLPEMIRLNREVIDNTVKFFLNLNENLLRIASHHEKGDTVRHNAEILNRVCDDYRKTHLAITETIMNTTRHTIENTFKARDLKVNPLDAVLDREEMFKLNQETLASTVKFFLNLNDELVRSIREPGRQVNLDTLVDEYQRIHRILSTRIETVWKETLDRLHRIHDHAAEIRPTHQTRIHTAKDVRNETVETVAGKDLVRPEIHDAKIERPVDATRKPRVTAKIAKKSRKI